MLFIFSTPVFIRHLWQLKRVAFMCCSVDDRNMLTKVAAAKGISETKLKQQRECSDCIHQPVTSWGNACSTYMHQPVTCMHWPVMSQANACTYCMGSKVLSLSQIYFYLQLL